MTPSEDDILRIISDTISLASGRDLTAEDSDVGIIGEDAGAIGSSGFYRAAVDGEG